MHVCRSFFCQHHNSDYCQTIFCSPCFHEENNKILILFLLKINIIILDEWLLFIIGWWRLSWFNYGWIKQIRFNEWYVIVRVFVCFFIGFVFRYEWNFFIVVFFFAVFFFFHLWYHVIGCYCINFGKKIIRIYSVFRLVKRKTHVERLFVWNLNSWMRTIIPQLHWSTFNLDKKKITFLFSLFKNSDIWNCGAIKRWKFVKVNAMLVVRWCKTICCCRRRPDQALYKPPRRSKNPEVSSPTPTPTSPVEDVQQSDSTTKSTKSKSARPSAEPYVPPSRRSQTLNKEPPPVASAINDNKEENDDEDDWEKLLDNDDNLPNNDLVEVKFQKIFHLFWVICFF